MGLISRINAVIAARSDYKPADLEAQMSIPPAGFRDQIAAKVINQFAISIGQKWAELPEISGQRRFFAVDDMVLYTVDNMNYRSVNTPWGVIQDIEVGVAYLEKDGGTVKYGLICGLGLFNIEWLIEAYSTILSRYKPNRIDFRSRIVILAIIDELKAAQA